MKTHPHLLLRDALAGAFVAACSGDAAAAARVAALERWAQGQEPGPALGEIRAEDGGALFANAVLEPRFTALEAYTRDRARRFGAALGWIRDANAMGDPLECGRAAWDAGLFFEVHEILEPVWGEATGARRDELQALIMAGAALHPLTEGNLAGAGGLLREAERRLLEAPGELALDLQAFARGLGALLRAIEAGRVASAADVDELPRLEPRETRLA
jgi:hypothetical protein